eukprot:CAMPEP_0194236770 /NCGR_PEP_ID=MMETSP0158-20130606/3956_1 /TAXON_ID=33649 /ORGANISM="Thalassionema nitzschioides, Strain L26-B" /LENGTH=404 /DNA_ID=CAMNT_0038970617 /DNA_START=38 /DNA_END=1249 /DNA_ORIENTATION=-
MDVDGSKVMTVLGPVNGEDIGLVLMNEHLACDPSKRNQLYLSKMKSFGGGHEEFNSPITMQNLSCIRLMPFTHTGNMSLSSTNDAYCELEHLKSSGCITVVDSTNIVHGRSYKSLENLARRLGINIIIGTSCSKFEAATLSPENNIEQGEENITRMERELLHGIDESNGIRAGFIGEVQVPERFDESGCWELKVSAMVQKSTNAPLIVTETIPSKYSLKILDQIAAYGGKINRTILSHMDMYASDLEFLKKVLDRGAFICFDRFTVSSSCFDPDQYFPTIKHVVECIYALLQDNISYLDQIVLSSGVFMKLQYRKYGGVEYNSLFEHLLPRLKVKGISEEQINTIVHWNPRKLLQWWTPPPEPERPKEYIPCSVCRKLFEPILGEYYTKYSFSYCGTDCLRQHR